MSKMSLEAVKSEVQSFYTSTAIGTQTADAFAAWWLHRRWNLERLVAMAHAPSGSNDFGIDAFHFEERADSGQTVLHLIQAKYSDSTALIKSAVKEFAPAVLCLQSVIKQTQLPPARVNEVWVKLHAEFGKRFGREEVSGERLLIRFEVVHTSQAASESIEQVISSAREALDSAMNDRLPRYGFSVRGIYPPAELEPDPIVPPKSPFNLRFSGEMISNSERVRFFAGFGYLSDLVALYERLGEPLFSKNVRSYLYRAHDKGPAKYMRESLNRACVRKNGKLTDEPTRFAMLHNGITLAATSVERHDKSVALFEPNVLNGCQTVKNAALWYADRAESPSFVDSAWQDIRVPLRVLISQDEDFISDVTISNNRQNAIKPSAFRANHRTQVQLAERLRDECGIYYERQESSFENLRKTKPKLLEDLYFNSQHKPLRMEDVAIGIACASKRPAISVAAKVSEVFEENVYQTLFVPEKLQHLELLVFLRNALVALPLALKDIRDIDSKFEKISAAKFAYPCLRVLSRWIVYFKPELARDFGDKVYRAFPADDGLRPKLRSLINGNSVQLRKYLKDFYLTDDDEWKSPNDAVAMDGILKTLDLHDVDVFSVYHEAIT